MQLKSNLLLEAALQYAGRGWPVFPVHPKGKKPLGELVPHGHKDAVCDEALIRRWWSQCPTANVAVRTGILSGLVVLDVDLRHGGEDSFYFLQQRYGPIPETVESLTGGGGRHLFFAHPSGAYRVRNATKLAGFSGIDLRGDGGYVLVPPSLHESGRDYAWELPSLPDVVPLAPLPAWLLNLVAIPPLSRPSPRPVTEWLDVLSHGVEQGTRNTSLTALTGHLLRCRVHPNVVLELMLAWNEARNHPPLVAEEVVRTVDSIAGAELRRRSRSRLTGTAGHAS